MRTHGARRLWVIEMLETSRALRGVRLAGGVTVPEVAVLDELRDVAAHIADTSLAYAKLAGDLASRIADPVVASLLLSKISQAREHGIHIWLAAGSELSRLSETHAACTVAALNTLLDFAADTLTGEDVAWVRVTLAQTPTELEITVQRSVTLASGFPDRARESAFATGYRSAEAVNYTAAFAQTQLLSSILSRLNTGLAVSRDGATTVATLSLCDTCE